MNCKNCDKQFDRNSSAQKYCSQKCRERNQAKGKLERNPNYWKEYYRKNKSRRLQQSKESQQRTGRNKRYAENGRLAHYNIISRCSNPNSPAYSRYGGKGVKCLISFEEFQQIYFSTDNCKICDVQLTDSNGRKDKTARTIDRIDSNGHYEADNLRIVCRSCNSRGGGETTNKMRWGT